MDGKVLGKIKQIDLINEYGSIMLFVELGSDTESWGVQNAYMIIPGLKARVTKKHDIFPLAQYMEDANVYKLEQMKNKPVEAVFEGNSLHSWRILKEVI